MSFFYSFTHPLKRFLGREENQFLLSMSIRSFAMGMVLIFEPIYIYLHFGESLSLTLIFFALIHGIYGILTVIGGKIMAKIGYDWSMLISHFFFLGYYILLSVINLSFFIIPLVIILKAFGMSLFWPSYHTSFTRFSKDGQRGKYVSKKLFTCIAPSVLGPVVGGIILTEFNYTFLFCSVLVFLLISALPLFLKREQKEVYSDGYKKAWGRIFKKENRKYSIGFAFASLEAGVNNYLWPLFMLILGIKYLSMGGITSFAIFLSAILALYAGKVSDSFKRVKLLNVGSFLTSVSWVLKCFVFNPLTAFLVHSSYKVFLYLAVVPFQTFFYEKAALEGDFADEFIISREITINIFKFIFLSSLAGIFFFFPNIYFAFLLAAIASLGFMILGKPSKAFKKNNDVNKN